jgi:hypothetical protein
MAIEIIRSGERLGTIDVRTIDARLRKVGGFMTSKVLGMDERCDSAAWHLASVAAVGLDVAVGAVEVTSARLG